MKIIKIAYSRTFPIQLTGIYEKIYLEAEVIEGEEVRKGLYDLKKQVTDFHFESNKAEEKQQIAAKVKMETDILTDGEWFKVQEQLLGIKYKEDAQRYLDTTDFRLTVGAKNIVNSKPSNNEKGNNKK